MQLNGSQIFVEVLCEQGVDTLFGYPGGAVLNLYDELYKNTDRITHVLTAHEQGAAHAADGYARATGPHRCGAGRPAARVPPIWSPALPRLYGLGAHGGLHRQRSHGGLGKDGFQEATLRASRCPLPSTISRCAGGRSGRHHALCLPYCTERPQGPGAGGYPQGRDGGGMRVHPQKAGADPHRYHL